MSVMVWCKSCKVCVWAYDHEPPEHDIRGIMNHLKMNCPRCGKQGDFDGWNGDDRKLALVFRYLRQGERLAPGTLLFEGDPWSIMRALAQLSGIVWAPSGDCSWFGEGIRKSIEEIFRGGDQVSRDEKDEEEE